MEWIARSSDMKVVSIGAIDKNILFISNLGIQNFPRVKHTYEMSFGMFWKVTCFKFNLLQ